MVFRVVIISLLLVLIVALLLASRDPPKVVRMLENDEMNRDSGMPEHKGRKINTFILFKPYYCLGAHIIGLFERLSGKKANLKLLTDVRKVRFDKKADDLRNEILTCMVGYVLIGIQILLIVFLLVSFFYKPASNLKEGYYIRRNEPGKGEKSVELYVSDDKTKSTEDKKVTVNVPDRVYTENEAEKIFDESLDYVDRVYLGENKDALHVNSNLNLVTDVSNSNVLVTWETEPLEVLESDGTVLNEFDDDSQEAYATVKLVCGSFEKSKTYPVTIVKKEYSSAQAEEKEWEEKVIKEQEENAESKWFALPKIVGKKKLKYFEKEKSVIMYFPLCLIIVIFSVPALMRSRLKSECEKRDRELKLSYPDFVDKFVLYLGAGLTVRSTWLKMTDEYRLKHKESKVKKTDYLYEEMLVTRHSLENGVNEGTAIMEFGKRISLVSYLKFCTILSQNLKKGTDDVLKLLEFEAQDAVNERREYIKILGEEAGTKLILPMVLMMGVVFAIIIFSAFQSM